MVGIVIISHSKELALSVCKLAEQAAKGAQIVGVGGTGDDGREFGTDAVAIMEAIQHVHSDDGVLLLMDMGSALLSAQTALDLLGEEISSNIYMCSAPLVEGAIVASVQSNIGADIHTIIHEVLQSLDAKRDQIGDVLENSNNAPSPKPETNTPTIPDNAITKEYVIQNTHGLHARPAATLVQMLATHKVQVYLALHTSPEKLISAKSLNAIAKMNIKQGDTLIVHCWSDDTETSLACIDELETLIVTEFGEKELSADEISKEKEALHASHKRRTIPADNEELSQPQTKPPQLISISRGLAIGQVWKVIDANTPKFTHTSTTDIETEQQELDSLLSRAQVKIIDDIKKTDNKTEKSILEMHQIMLQDPELITSARNMIQEHKYTAAYAWWIHCNTVSQEYAEIKDNQYLNERANDLLDVAIRVIRESSTVELPKIESPPSHAILFIEEITPDIISQIDINELKGIVTRNCGITSHVAIIARTKNIPMISGFSDFDTLAQGIPVAINANCAEVFINPSKKVIEDLQEKIIYLQELKQTLYSHTKETAITLDGITIECAANIGSKDEANNLLEYGADGVGLFRSEFLFLNKQSPPSEEEHYQNYHHVAKCLQGKPVIIRLLDIGGDKQIAYMNMPKENNPFLGMRGVRLYPKYRDLLITQIKAILRAATNCGNISMMIPMVADLNEIKVVKNIVGEAIQKLQADNIPHAHNVPLGIMIETPASVMSARTLTQHSDFFSIGTNDLTQYILAIERESSELAYLYDTCNPSVLRSIYQVASLTTQNNISVSVCGEAGSDFEVLPLLLAMGVRKLSVTPSRIPAVKHLVRTLSISDCKQLLRQVLEMHSSSSIREHVHNTFQEVARLNASL